MQLARRARMLRLPLILLFLGCAAGDAETAFSDDLDGKADSVNELSAHINGLTLWTDRVALPDGNRFRLEGRISKDLKEVFAFVPDDAFCSAKTLSARRFEVSCETGHELNTVLSGLPLLLTLTPKSGAPATGALWFAPVFGHFSGGTGIYVTSAVTPIWYGGELLYRGHATLASGLSGLNVFTDEDGGAFIFPPGGSGSKVRFDWSYDQLALALTHPVHFASSDAQGKSIRKDAALDARIVKIGLTSGDAETAFGESCSPKVQACLAKLPGWLDTESCGAYRAVQRCGGTPPLTAPSPAKLVSDFRSFLGGYYAQHGADLSGANTLAQARAAVAADHFERITAEDGDPNAHDLSTVAVFRHPDVVWPGSDTAWFAAYDLASHKLIEIYDFN
jgi:hypothetical protein